MHRLSGGDQALAAGPLAELERARIDVEPADAVLRSAWLFRPRWQLSETPKSEAARIGEHCSRALREILDQEGWPGALRLVEAAQAPEVVGEVLARINRADSDGRILPELLVTANDKTMQFVNAYVQKRFEQVGRDWIEGLRIADWSAEEVARFLALLPLNPLTWEAAKRHGDEVETRYWRQVPPDGCRDDAATAILAAVMFIKHGRAAAALVALHSAHAQKAPIRTGLIMDALEAWIKSSAGNADSYQVSVLLIFFIRELQRLAAQPDQTVDLDRLANLEWQYLGLLDGRVASPMMLHQRLRNDPEFFVDVLELAFQPRRQSAAGESVPEAVPRRAEAAFRLLATWRDVPGERPGQGVDERALAAWCRTARAQAESRGLRAIADSRIGEVFASAPQENDGSWPCVPVRDALEAIGTDEVFQGLAAGILNRRGFYYKDPGEAGAQERDLAHEYKSSARAIASEWPKTAATLLHVAEYCEAEARREDDQAALD